MLGDVLIFLTVTTLGSLIMKKHCKVCQSEFVISLLEESLLKSAAPNFAGHSYPLPSPTLCPDCRFQRRLAFRHETALYKRKCDLTGTEIISAISPDKPFKVYRAEEYWKDSWEPLSYGRDYEFGTSFFEQFGKLQLVVPRISRAVDDTNENSTYVNQANCVKNCYLIWGGVNSEECYYSYRIFDSKTCIDCSFTYASELCYECFDVFGCYESSYLEQSLNCSDSSLLFDCHSCSNCILSSNLHNAQYCIRNKQCTKKEFFLAKAQIDLSDRRNLPSLFKEFAEIKSKSILKATHNIGCENVTGGDLRDCKNALNCFNCVALEDCCNCFLHSAGRSCSDVSYSWNNIELCREGITIGEKSYKVHFAIDCWGLKNSLYCDSVINSSNCFGCIGLSRKEYCILNKQYSPNEYEKLLPQILDEMTKRGEYGEFFPTSLSAICYNESPNQYYFPLSKEQVISAGLKWKDPDQREYQQSKYNPPAKLAEVPDSITKEVLSCKSCRKNYKLLAQELRFYKTLKVAIPENCCDCRNDRRMRLRNSRKLFSGLCGQCGEKVPTTWPNTLNVMCDECYREATI